MCYNIVLSGQYHVCVFSPNIRMSLPHCHHPNWSAGDNRVLGRPSLERRAFCRRRRSRRRRRRSSEKERRWGKGEEEGVAQSGDLGGDGHHQHDGEDLGGDGPPVLVSVPLTLKVEVNLKYINSVKLKSHTTSHPTMTNKIPSVKVGEEAFLPCFVSRLGTCQV